MSLYARGLRAWLRGDEGDDAEAAEAAGRNVANVLVMLRQFMGAEGE